MQKADNLRSAVLLVGRHLTMGIAVLASLLQATLLNGQVKTDELLDLPLQIKDGRIVPDQRVWIAGQDGRPLMRYPLEELRELERVYRETTQLAGQLESAKIEVALENQSASVRAEFTANTSLKGVVNRIELGLKTCQLVEAPVYQVIDQPPEAGSEETSQAPLSPNGGQDTELIQSDEKPERAESDQQRVIPTIDGYQWLILTSKPSKHRIALNAKTMVDRSSDRHRFTIDLPLVQSSIRVRLSGDAVDVRVRSEDLIVDRGTDESGQWLEVRTRGGSFTLSWNHADTLRTVGIVQARSQTVYEPFDLQSPSQSWSASTTLSIRWTASAGSQKILIQLPRGGQWSNLPYSELDRFRISTLSAAEASQVWNELELSKSSIQTGPVRENLDTSGTQEASVLQDDSQDASENSGLADILVIENLDPANLPTVDDLSLQWRWVPELISADSQHGEFMVSAPALAGVDLQEGSIAVIYPSSYDFSYRELKGTQFLEHTSSMEAGSKRDQVLFGFQNTSGKVAISFRRESSLPTIRPVYRVHVSDERLELTAWYHCWFDGTPSEVSWQPSGWQIDESSAVLLREPSVPSTGSVEPLKVERRQDGSIVFSSHGDGNSTTQQRSEHVWRLQAYRDWSPGEDPRLEIKLPGFDRGTSTEQSRVDYGSGVLILSGEQYVVLRQDKQESRGIWVDETDPSSMSYLRPGTGTSQFYRFNSPNEVPQWIGRATMLPQRISMSQSAELELLPDRILVTQNLLLNIENRPTESLRLIVREDALPIQMTMGENLLNYETGPTQEVSQKPSEGPAWKEVIVSDFPKLIGDIQLVVKSGIGWKLEQQVTGQPDSRTSDDQLQAKVEVPLVGVLEVEEHAELRGLWQLRRDPSMEVRYLPGQDAKEDYQPVDGGPVDLKSGQRSIQLSIIQRTARLDKMVITNGIWLQTLLTPNERRDRLVARVRSNSRRATLQLPDQAVLERVALDSELVMRDLAPYDYNTNHLAVLLPDDREHVVEVIYSVSQPLSWAQRVEIVPAVLESKSSLDRFTWQLVTPNIYHLGWCPPELTAEWKWQWDSVGLSRHSSLDQPKLEQWMGAASLSRIPVGTNSYVMSSAQPPASINIWILSRFAFWLPCGLTALGLALLVANVRALRSPNTVILAAAMIGCCALVWPEASLLFGQSAIVSLVLVVIIWLTQAAVSSRVQRRSIFAPASPILREMSGSGPSLSVRNRASSFTNSPTRPAAVDSSGAD